ncbi:MAG: hypothetical protein II627_02015 [Lachnospiraceae bacterium]|nr:hypothetical protein [Lachnospiraceae bacterium]
MKKSPPAVVILTFTEPDALGSYLENAVIDLIIIGGSISQDTFVSRMQPDYQVLPPDLGISAAENQGHGYVRRIVRLSDEDEDLREDSSGIFYLSRFRSTRVLPELITDLCADRKRSDRGAFSREKGIGIVRESQIGYGGQPGGGYPGGGYSAAGGAYKKNCRLIGVYSPVSRCGKTSLSLMFTRILSEETPALLITMDQFSAAFASENHNLTDLIFSLTKSDGLRLTDQREHDLSEYKDFINVFGDIHYIPAPVIPADLTEISGGQMVKLLDMVACRSNYHYAVVDLPEGMDDLRAVLGLCDDVFMPQMDDVISKSKIRFSEQQMAAICPEDEWERMRRKTHKISMSPVIDADSPENYYQELYWSDFGRAARQYLSSYGIL